MSASDWRPDPAQGIFETMLVVAGEPVELDGHLARFGRSLREVYGAELPAEVGERIRSEASVVALGRLRLTAAPVSGELAFDVSAREIDPGIMFPAAGAALQQVDRPGGNGSHKWVDRRGMEHPDAGAGQLICDGAEALEAGWANLFAVRQETLWTPAADGRLLAGRARAAVLELARDEGLETREQPLHVKDLLTADEVFLTNSIRGIEPATALDGAPLPGCGPLSRRLADALRRRWGLSPTAHKAAATAPKADQLSH